MRLFKKIFPTLITAAIFGLIVWYFINNQEAFDELLHIPVSLLVLLVVLKIVRIFNSGQFTKATIDAFNNKIPAKESFYIALISSMGNFFGPFLGGASVRAVYLKKKYKFSYTDFASTLSGFYFITFIVYSFLGLLALLAIQLQDGIYSTLLYLVFAAWFIGTVALAKVKSLTGLLHKIEGKLGPFNKMLKQLNSVIVGWRVLKDDKRLYRKLVWLTFIGFLISFAVSWVEFSAVNATKALAPLSLYVVLSALSLLLSITPSAIGVREAIFIFSSQLLGLSTQQVLQIALIDRAATFAVMGTSYMVIKSHGGFKKIVAKQSST